MIKKAIKFRDFNGEEQTEVWYFNLTEAEATRLEANFPGGLSNFIESMEDNAEPEDILALFEMLIQKSVGVRSPDGSRFVKNDETLDDFLSSAAYSALFVELATDADKAAAFFNGVMSVTSLNPPKRETE